MMSEENETYLGDGLYASFDGYQFKLRAPRFDRGDQEVYLDSTVWRSFLAYISKTLEVEIEVTRREKSDG